MLTFTLLLWFTRRTDQSANRFLAAALLVVVLWIARLLAIDIGLATYIPLWSRLPMQFSLALGPLLFFYVLKITQPEYRFKGRDMLHFAPLLLENGVLIGEIGQSLRAGAETYQTLTFRRLNPGLELLAFTSVVIYIIKCRICIKKFYKQLKFSGGDRYRSQFRWLDNILAGFGLLWVLWIPVAAVGYFCPGVQLHDFLYLPLISMITFWAASVFSRHELHILNSSPLMIKPPIPAALREKGSWLKNIVREQRYYEDPELSLKSLAEKLGWHTHELSRILNLVLKKSFNDFINEYRVKAVTLKMLDHAYDHVTLLGIAYESGFNSQSTFTRIFKQVTGKSPLEYKNYWSTYKLGSQAGTATLISTQEAPPTVFGENKSQFYA